MISIPINIWSSSGNAEFFFFYFLEHYDFGSKHLGQSSQDFKIDLDLRETEILKLKGYISQSVVLRRSIRFREFYSIHYIFSGLLKSPFPHSKNVKILDFSNFGQKPLQGSLIGFGHWELVWNALIWCLAVSDIHFCSFLTTFFLTPTHIYGFF